jgi:DNA-binding transcriptional ArsR family regulator
MVDITFADDPTAAEIERALERIRPAGAMPRGIAGGRELEFDAEDEQFTVHFDNLRRSLIEHRLFEEAQGFSSSELTLLRIVEAGADRMSFGEICDTADDHDALADIEEDTYQHHLRRLRDKGLIEHQRNQYTYVGP